MATQDNRKRWWEQLLMNGQQQAPPGMDDSLTDEQKQWLRRQQMGASGAAMLANSGWSDVPITTGQALAQAFGAGQQGYAQGRDTLMQQLQMQAERSKREAQQKAEQAWLQGKTPEQVQMAQLWGVGPYAKMEYEGRQKKEQADAERMAKSTPGELMTRVVGGKEYYYDGKSWKLIPKEKAAAAAKPSALQEKIDFARSLGASDEDIRMMVLGTSEKDAVDDSSGLNPRQQSGMAARNSAALDYASNLTGLSKADLGQMSPEQVEQAILEKGGRFVQGGVARAVAGIPLIGEGIVSSINSDISPWGSQMAAGQVSVNNPAGDVGEKAFQLAERQVPTAQMDLDVQAQMIRKMLEQSPAKPAQSKRKRYNPQTGQLEDVL